MSTTPQVWIVAVNYNGLDDTCKCLRSVALLATPRVSVVVVDNASVVDPTPALRAEFPWAHLIRNPSNCGWAGGNNAGIAYALERGADQVILLNNDTTVIADFVERLLSAAAAHPEFGVIGPVINFMDDPDEVMTDGCDFNRPDQSGFFQRHYVPVTRAEPPAIAEVDIVNGCCMMIRRNVFDRIGLIDERFFLIHEESDFCLRARHAGFRCGVFGESLVWHKGSSSFKRSGKRWQRYYDARNLALLLQKHRKTHEHGRRAWKSCVQYLQYVFHRYAVEREEGQIDAANAVIEGLCDAIAGRFGAYAQRRRLALPLFRALFELCRKRSVPQAQNEEAPTGAAAFR